MAQKQSVVEYFGLGDGHRCGYCGSPDTNVSHGMWTHILTCQDYQDLIDRGWRRSGKYCYKPLMNATCCPLYTIRCDTARFSPTKSQKKVLKKMNKYLIHGKAPAKVQETDKLETASNTTSNSIAMTENQSGHESFIEPNKKAELEQILVTTSINNEELKDSATAKNSVLEADVEADVVLETPKMHIKGPDPNRERCRKAKVIRKERKLKKLAAEAAREGKDFDSSSVTNKASTSKEEKSIENFIEDLPPEDQLAHRLEVKLLRVDMKSSEFKQYFSSAFELFCKYQKFVHHDPPEKLKERRFRRFLVDCPLTPETPEESDSCPPSGLGAFHQQYYIDGKLIAVGVIDILPTGVSSKYFFYDPDYSFLSLGTYSAIREIYFIRSMHNVYPELRHYYMGFYVHSCQKMCYKGKYDPSYLLCPETYKWNPIKSCIPKLEVNKYSKFDDAEVDNTPIDVDSALILFQQQAMPFSIYCNVFLDSDEKANQQREVGEYANLAGLTSHRMLLYRN